MKAFSVRKDRDTHVLSLVEFHIRPESFLVSAFKQAGTNDVPDIRVMS